MSVRLEPTSVHSRVHQQEHWGLTWYSMSFSAWPLSSSLEALKKLQVPKHREEVAVTRWTAAKQQCLPNHTPPVPYFKGQAVLQSSGDFSTKALRRHCAATVEQGRLGQMAVGVGGTTGTKK